MPADITVWRYQLRNKLRQLQTDSLILLSIFTLFILTASSFGFYWIGVNQDSNGGPLIIGGIFLILYAWVYLASLLKLGQSEISETLPISTRAIIWHQIIKLELALIILATVTVFSFYAGKLNWAAHSTQEIVILWLAAVLVTISLANLGIVAAITVRLIAKNNVIRTLLGLGAAVIFYQIVPSGNYPLAAVVDSSLTRLISDELVTLLLASIGLIGFGIVIVELTLNQLSRQLRTDRKSRYWGSLSKQKNLNGAFNLAEAILIIELLRLARDVKTHWRIFLIFTISGISLLITKQLVTTADTIISTLIMIISYGLIGSVIGLSAGRAAWIRTNSLSTTRAEIWLFSFIAGTFIGVIAAISLAYLFFSALLKPLPLFIIAASVVFIFSGFGFRLAAANLKNASITFIILSTIAFFSFMTTVFIEEIGWVEALGMLFLWGAAIMLTISYFLRKRFQNYQPSYSILES